MWKQELKKMEQWRMLMRDLRASLPHLKIGHATATCDACFRCFAYPPDREPVGTNQEGEPLSRRWAVVGCMSILAPVYTVHGVQYDYRGKERIAEKALFEPLPPEMQAPAEIVARKIEAMFGVEALPLEIAETRIPLIVEQQEPPHTTLFHALFTSWPERVPL
jgi:hypothetical protein